MNLEEWLTQHYHYALIMKNILKNNSIIFYNKKNYLEIIRGNNKI